MEEKKITYVLDLRSRSEVEQAPDRIRENFTYYSIPMSDRMNDSQKRFRYRKDYPIFTLRF